MAIRGGERSARAARRSAEPKHAVRASRVAGRRMRSQLLDAASRLFKEQGLGGVSIADIAAAADAFPSKITYYFRTKEALFVEAACRDVLYAARGAEEAARGARDPQDYTRALVMAVTGTDSVAFFVEAMTLTRRRQDLAPLVERTIERLHGEGERAYEAEMRIHGWRSRRGADLTARRFWTIAIGVTLEGYATGGASEELGAEMLRLLEPQADPAVGDARQLKLVADEDDQKIPSLAASIGNRKP